MSSTQTSIEKTGRLTPTAESGNIVTRLRSAAAVWCAKKTGVGHGCPPETMMKMNLTPQRLDTSTHCLQKNAEARLCELGGNILHAMEHIRTALYEWSLAAVDSALKAAPGLQAQARDIEITCMSGLPRCEDELARFRLTACIQYARRLERVVHQMATMGMHLVHIVRLNASPDTSTLLPLYLLAEIELRDALLAGRHGDGNLARGVLDRDRELDARFRSELEVVIRDLSLGLHETEAGLSLIFVLRAVERIGDHAKELASSALLQPGGMAAEPSSVSLRPRQAERSRADHTPMTRNSLERLA